MYCPLFVHIVKKMSDNFSFLSLQSIHCHRKDTRVDYMAGGCHYTAVTYGCTLFTRVKKRTRTYICTCARARANVHIAFLDPCL
jgi:hypothetical protein